MIYFCVGMTYCNQKSGGLNSCMLFTVGLGQLATVLNETGTLIQYPSCPWSIEPLKLPNCWLARNWGLQLPNPWLSRKQWAPNVCDSFLPGNVRWSILIIALATPRSIIQKRCLKTWACVKNYNIHIYIYIYMSIASKWFTNRIDSWTSCKRNCVAEVLKAVMSRKDPLTSTWLLHQPCAV